MPAPAAPPPRGGKGKPPLAAAKPKRPPPPEDSDEESIPPDSDGEEEHGGPAAPITDIAALKSEVAAFAAQLGLGGSVDGFNDIDFRPKKVKPAAADVAAGAPAAAATGQAGAAAKGKSKPAAADADDEEDEDEDGAKTGSDKQQQPKLPARAWNVGAGPRPDAIKLEAPSAAVAPAVAAVGVVFGIDEPTCWHVALAALPPLSTPASEPPRDDAAVARARAAAAKALSIAAAAAEARAGPDAKWLHTVRKAGTTADRLAAWTLLVQEWAVGNLRSLDALLAMAESKAKRQAAQAVDSLRELFGGGALLPDRKLRAFEEQPVAAALAAAAAADARAASGAGAGQSGRGGGARPGGRAAPSNGPPTSALAHTGGSSERKRLLYWLLEDELKARYGRFVAILTAASRDPLPYLKDKALKAAAELLSKKPERERELLALLANKLGDPERKSASRAGYLLARLLDTHPAMARVVAREVEDFAFRPGVGLRAQYYAAVFLNQIVLSHRGDGPRLAKQLVECYFALFKKFMAAAQEARGGPPAPGDGKSRNGLRAAAVPAARGKRAPPGGHGRAAAAARAAAEAAARKAAAAADQAVDSRLLSALLTGINRAFPYVGADDVEPLMAAHTPALFRMAHSPNFNAGLQALTLLFHMMAARQAVSDRFYRAFYATLLAPGLAKTSKPAMLLALLLKALRADVAPARAAALAKRSLQVALHQPAHFACGTLLMLSELLKNKPALWNAVLQPEEHDEDEGDVGAARAARAGAGSDSEAEDDDGGSDGDTDADRRRARAAMRGAGPPSSDGAGASVSAADASEPAPGAWPRADGYDMKKRDPAHCGAGSSCWWELTALAMHAHPSVAAMARTLLSGASVVYAGNPLRELTQSAFLDRFLLKKPKCAAGARRGASLMQAEPAPALALAGGGAPELGSKEFTRLPEEDVRAEEVFFHRFYSAKAKGEKAAKLARQQLRAKKRDDSDDEDMDLDDDDEDGDREDDVELGSVEDDDGSEGSGSDGEQSASDSDEEEAAAAGKRAKPAKAKAAAKAQGTKKAAAGSDDDSDGDGELDPSSNGDGDFASDSDEDDVAAYLDGQAEQDEMALADEDDYDYADLAAAVGEDSDADASDDDEEEDEDEVEGGADSGEEDDDDDAEDEEGEESEEEEDLPPRAAPKRKAARSAGVGAFASAEDYAALLEGDAPPDDGNRAPDDGAAADSDSEDERVLGGGRSARSSRGGATRSGKAPPKGVRGAATGAKRHRGR